MKNVIITIVSIFLLTSFCFTPFDKTFATTSETENIEEQLVESIEIQLDSLELGAVEEMYDEFVNADERSFSDLLNGALNGEFSFSFPTILDFISDQIVNTIKSKYKLLLIILLIAFISALIDNMVISKKSSGFSSSISFVFVVFIASIISYTVIDVVKEASVTLSNIGSLAETVCPILLALMVSVGAVSSSAIYQPAVTAMTTLIINIFSDIVFGIIIFIFILTILGSIVDKFKLEKLNQFCSSFVKWVVAVVFTLFMGFLSVQGITAGGYDGLSIKTAKYAIRSYIPMVGGYLSEGFEVFRGGSILIKNSLGVIGIVVLFSMVLSPIVELIALNLTFRLASAFTEMIGAGKISNLLSGVTKIFTFLIAIIFAVFMMCFILFLLIIMTANVV